MRCNLEGYTSNWEWRQTNTRGVLFYDVGGIYQARKFSGISGAGFGLRSSFLTRYSLRLDAARIMNAGTDPLQQKGDWRLHASLVATF